MSVGPKITLSWPSSLTNYVLKVASELSPNAAWNTVTNTPASIGGQVTITLDRSTGNRFYILAPKSQ